MKSSRDLRSTADAATTGSDHSPDSGTTRARERLLQEIAEMEGEPGDTLWSVGLDVKCWRGLAAQLELQTVDLDAFLAAARQEGYWRGVAAAMRLAAEQKASGANGRGPAGQASGMNK